MNQRLFEVGYMDRIEEIKPPSKEQRYLLLKEVLKDQEIEVPDIMV